MDVKTIKRWFSIAGTIIVILSFCAGILGNAISTGQYKEKIEHQESEIKYLKTMDDDLLKRSEANRNDIQSMKSDIEIIKNNSETLIKMHLK